MSNSVLIGNVEVAINPRLHEFGVPSAGNFDISAVDLKQLNRIAVSINMNRALILEGPTGAGKTALIKYLAHATNNVYSRVQMTGSTDIENFVGHFAIDKNVGTVWVDGALTLAMKHGYWLLLDEFNMALPEIVALVNSVLDDDKTLTLDTKDGTTIIKAHPDFRLFATMNPSDEYAGTKQLNIATENRYQKILFEYPNLEQEISILEAHTKISKFFGAVPETVDITGDYSTSFLSRAVLTARDIRDMKEQNEIYSLCSTRQLIDWCIFSRQLGIKDAFEFVVCNKAIPEDREKLMDIVNKYFLTIESFEKFDTEFFKIKDKIEVLEQKSEEKKMNSKLVQDIQDNFAMYKETFKSIDNSIGIDATVINSVSA